MIHSQSGTVTERSSGGSASSAASMAMATPKDGNHGARRNRADGGLAQPVAEEHVDQRARRRKGKQEPRELQHGNKSSNAGPAMARPVMQSSAAPHASASRRVLPLQQVDLVDVGRVHVAVVRDQNRQTHGHFGRRHGHDHEDEDLAVEIAPLAAQRDQRQVHAVEHHLHAHEDDQGAAPAQHAHGADQKDDGAQDQVVAMVGIIAPTFGD